MRKYLLSLIYVVIGLVAFGNPYGLKKGMTIDELRNIDNSIFDFGDDEYFLNIVPKPAINIEDYYVLVHPIKGLYYLKANGKNIKTDKYGETLINEYKRIQSELINIYGKPVVYDRTYVYEFGKRNGIMTIKWLPEEFMYSICRAGREIISIWGENESINDEIKKIEMTIVSTSMESGSIDIAYYFTNYE